jgi:hypothetical protein
MKDVISTLELIVAHLERMAIEYVIMGGLAVRAYAIPRATEDVDFTLALGGEQLVEFLHSLDSEDFDVPEPYQKGWVDEVNGLKLVKIKRYVIGRTIDVDLFLADSDYQDEVLRRKCLADVEGRRYWIASADDLVLPKFVAGRPRDLIDVADVLFTQGELDVQYMQYWAKQLRVEQQLANALANKPDERP